MEDPNGPFPYSHCNSWKDIEEYDFKVIFKVDNYLSSLTADSFANPNLEPIMTELEEIR
jgi:hypothetical protein